MKKITAQQPALFPLLLTLSTSNLIAAPMDEVVVSANALGKPALDMTSPAIVLDKAELEFLAGNSIGNTLNSLPGMSATQYGQGASRPIIRGLDGPRVRVLNDGLGMLDASDVSPDHSVTTEPLLANNIEVLKGPATLLYGGGAIGGVVNVLDNRIPAKSLDEEKNNYEGVIETRRDTVNSSETTLGSVTTNAKLNNNNTVALNIQGLNRDGKDYSIDGKNVATAEEFDEVEIFSGRVPNSFNDTHNYSIGSSLIRDNGFVGIAYSRQLSQYGLPNEAEEAPYIDLDQQRFDLRSDWEVENSFIENVRTRVATSDYVHREIAEGEVGTTFENDAQEARLEIVHAPVAGWKGVIGGQGLLRDFSALGEEAYVPETDTHNYALFVLEEYQMNQWRFELGARHEWQSINVNDASLENVDHRGNSFSSGAVWEFVEGWTLHGTLSKSQRLPSAEEIYANGPHLATSTFEIGNIDLDEETAQNIEFSLRKNSGAFTGELTVYRNNINDFIYAADTGNIVDEEGLTSDDGFREVIYSQEDTTFTGIEAELSYAFTDNFSASVFGDRVKGELDDTINDSDYLPRMPANRIGTRLDHTIELQDGKFISTQATYYHVNKQGHTAAFETDTDGYDELAFGVNYHIPVSTRTAVELFLNGSNLLDEEQRAHTSFIKDIVPMPGRNVSLGARLFF